MNIGVLVPGATFHPGWGSRLVVLAACLYSLIVDLSSLTVDMGPCGSFCQLGLSCAINWSFGLFWPQSLVVCSQRLFCARGCYIVNIA